MLLNCRQRDRLAVALGLLFVCFVDTVERRVSVKPEIDAPPLLVGQLDGSAMDVVFKSPNQWSFIGAEMAGAGRAVAPPLIVSIAVFWDWRVAMFMAGAMGFAVATTLTTQWRIVRDDVVRPKRSHDLSFFQEIRTLASGSLFLFFIFFIFNALTTHGVHSFIVALARATTSAGDTSMVLTCSSP